MYNGQYKLKSHITKPKICLAAGGRGQGGQKMAAG
jgi:hypothetical protein